MNIKKIITTFLVCCTLVGVFSLNDVNAVSYKTTPQKPFVSLWCGTGKGFGISFSSQNIGEYYQLQVAKDKGFKNIVKDATSFSFPTLLMKNISLDKSGTYYVRVRYYNCHGKLQGKKMIYKNDYSPWSRVYKINTKIKIPVFTVGTQEVLDLWEDYKDWKKIIFG